MLVTECFHPAVDGATATVRHLADQLIDAGHEVVLVAAAPGLSSYRKAPVRRVRPHDRPGRQVRALLEQERPDVVQVASADVPGGGRIGRKALAHAQRLGLRTVLVGRDGWTPGADTSAYSPALRDEHLHERWGRGRPGRDPLVVVGYAGPLRRSHGARLLAALAGVPGIRPVVIGDGPQRGWIGRHLPTAKLTGSLEGHELAVALASLDLLVHTCQVDGCYHALPEAAASAVPVVAPRAGAGAALVRHLETGLLHEPGDATDLRRAVAALAADRHRHRMGAHARRLAVERPWARAAEELLAVPAGDRTRR